ncbi:MAG TPA: hypothetical protein VML55_05265 [Planctomycetaceae bacterium]|nr:hypothetical protein [Planctomycetaceae bacterium]
MDQDPLVMEEIDAGAELARRFNDYAPLKAAFWLKVAPDQQRYLYIASDAINDTNFDRAYGEVFRILSQMRTPSLDPFRVKVIGGDNPLARAAVDIHNRFPAPLASRLRDTEFGGVIADDVYLYPSPLPA